MEDCLSAMSIFSVRFFIRLWKRTLLFARILIRPDDDVLLIRVGKSFKIGAAPARAGRRWVKLSR